MISERFMASPPMVLAALPRASYARLSRGTPSGGRLGCALHRGFVEDGSATQDEGHTSRALEFPLLLGLAAIWVGHQGLAVPLTVPLVPLICNDST